MRRGLAPSVFLLGLFAISACAFKHATLFPPSPSPKKPIKDVYSIVLLFDGARPQDVDRLVAEGRLPNIQRLFYEQGARYQNAIAVVPTASTPSHQSFLSGLFPGHHGIPSLDWFSRPLEKYIDYLKPRDVSLTNTYLFNFKQVERGRIETDQPQLIFHDLEGHPTMTVFESVTSGATLVLPENPPFLTAYHGKIEKFYEQFDLAAMKLALEKFRKLPLGELPRFTFVACYGMDLVAHFDGLKGSRVPDLYLQYDRFVGDLEKTLRERGIWEKTTLVALSDHGQHELSRATDLRGILKRVGLSPSQVMFGDHGLAFSNLYFKMGPDWERRPIYSELKNFPRGEEKPVDLIAEFLEEPDIEWVIVPDGPWRLHLHRRDGHAVIEKRLESGRAYYRYHPDPGSDPLEYLDRPEIAAWVKDGGFQDPEAWLKATQDETFPDAVVLLSTLFGDYRVGDMVLFTEKDTQFKEKRLAGHGSMYAEDLRVLLMFHGPGILPGLYPYARSVDLYPTLLALFGLTPRQPIDGVARMEPWGMPTEKTGSGLTGGFGIGEFRGRLMETLGNGGLTREKQEKARQMLFSLEAFEEERRRYAQPGTETLQQGIAQKPACGSDPLKSPCAGTAGENPRP